MGKNTMINLLNFLFYWGFFFALIAAFIHVQKQKKKTKIVNEKLISNINTVVKNLEDNIESDKAFKKEVADTLRDLSASISNLEKKMK